MHSKNSGSLAFLSNGATQKSCINNLNHEGLMTIEGSNVTIGYISTSRDSTVTMTNSVIHLTLSEVYQSAGSFGGVGSIIGNFENVKGAKIMGMSDISPTTITISEDFSNSGTIYFMINSRDLSQTGGFTTINAQKGVQLSGGRACICLSPDVTFETGDKFDLVNAVNALEGDFDTVEFACTECSTRTARSVEAAESTCDPVTETSSRSFSVLFESCDGGSGSNFLTSITPPYYVIIPVAVGIILLLVVVFGGALFIDERLRKRKFQQKSKSKRNNRVSAMKRAAAPKTSISTNASSSSDASSSLI